MKIHHPVKVVNIGIDFVVVAITLDRVVGFLFTLAREETLHQLTDQFLTSYSPLFCNLVEGFQVNFIVFINANRKTFYRCHATSLDPHAWLCSQGNRPGNLPVCSADRFPLAFLWISLVLPLLLCGQGAIPGRSFLC